MLLRSVVDFVPVESEERTARLVASTEALDSHGTVVRQNWDLSRFMQNPVILWGHDSGELPIARATDVGVVDGALQAKIAFAPTQRAAEVYEMLRTGFLKGVSVGFRSHEQRKEMVGDREVMVLDKNELYEISLVSVPSNPQTLAQLRSAVFTEDEMSEQHEPITVTDAVEDATRAIVDAGYQIADAAPLFRAAGVADLGGLMTFIEQSKAALTERDELRAQVAKQAAEIEDGKRSAIVKQLRAEGRVTPAQEREFLPTLSLDALTAYAKSAPVLLSKSAHEEPETDTKTNTFNGKTWKQLSVGEMQQLYTQNADLYARMKPAFEE